MMTMEMNEMRNKTKEEKITQEKIKCYKLNK